MMSYIKLAMDEQLPSERVVLCIQQSIEIFLHLYVTCKAFSHQTFLFLEGGETLHASQ